MYIYIHIPFCASICTYCDFPKVLYDNKYINTYLDLLAKEIKERYKNEPIKSIYIGGGTPTCLNKEQLEKLLNLTNIFKKEEKIEFTIESNVESLTEDKIKLLKQYKVNRVSLGVQTFQKDILKELNRHHTKEMVFQVVEKLKQHKIENISIDYMYAINNNIDKVKQDIETFLELNIPHISCYSLIIEDGTILKINNKKPIAEDIDEKMYKTIKKILTKNNYTHYEISNYAKKGFESIHNLNYWNNGNYYGFGLGAVSYNNNIRTMNTKNLTKYLKGQYIQEEIKENLNETISNELILGLRKIEGINIDEFQKKYKKNIIDCYNIKELLQERKIEVNNNHIRIPEKYIYISNDILVNFI